MFKKTLSAFNDIGKRLISTVQKFLNSYKKVATKRTYESLEVSTSFDGLTSSEVCLYGSKAFEYIENGRPPGAKLPPGPATPNFTPTDEQKEGWESLKKWMESKGIPLSSQYPVRRAIAVSGIKPTPVLEMSFVEIESYADAVVSESILEGISEDVNKLVQDGFAFPEIKL